MKKKIFTTIGLMSGTSMDGVDLSAIKSDGYNNLLSIFMINIMNLMMNLQSINYFKR